jgi:hypothetical protein
MFERMLALFLVCSLAIGLLACQGSRVDPISPDVRGVRVTPPQMVGESRYFYLRQDPTTRKWYPARELIPGFGHMIYTKEGAARLERDLWDNR